MIEHPNVNQGQRLLQAPRSSSAWLGSSTPLGWTWVKDHGRGVVAQGALHHLPWVDPRTVNRAGEQDLARQDPDAGCRAPPPRTAPGPGRRGAYSRTGAAISDPGPSAGQRASAVLPRLREDAASSSVMREDDSRRSRRSVSRAGLPKSAAAARSAVRQDSREARLPEHAVCGARRALTESTGRQDQGFDKPALFILLL